MSVLCPYTDISCFSSKEACDNEKKLYDTLDLTTNMIDRLI